ncbi:preprotein translocase subunit SecE [Candidatus Gracilibacteria bacterium]|nr:preprotein translocase subunit SecE [Candidatus Gracilibacteria bacterium]
MIKFLKESIKEFEHVVWPTPNETKKYFYIVVSMITGLTIFLFIASSIFSEGLFFSKAQIHPSDNFPTTTNTTDSDFDLKDVILNSGTTSSGSSQDTQTGELNLKDLNINNTTSATPKK